MLKQLLVAASVVAMMILAAGAAEAAPGYATANVNLRAGPGTQYPIVAVMRAGDRVEIHGCTSGWTWCDIDWRGYRGWAAGRYLQVLYQQRRRPVTRYGRYLGIPFLSFSIEPYWNNHYRTRPFYNERPKFERKPQPRLERKRGSRSQNSRGSRSRGSKRKPQPRLERKPQPKFEKKLPVPNVHKPYRCPAGQHLVNGVCK